MLAASPEAAVLAATPALNSSRAILTWYSSSSSRRFRFRAVYPCLGTYTTSLSRSSLRSASLIGVRLTPYRSVNATSGNLSPGLYTQRVISDLSCSYTESLSVLFATKPHFRAFLQTPYSSHPPPLIPRTWRRVRWSVLQRPRSPLRRGPLATLLPPATRPQRSPSRSSLRR